MLDLLKHVNLPWLSKNTLILCRHGSWAYGTNTPESDEDFKGVAVAPREMYLGFSKTWEQAESKEPDLVIYELRKFFNLAAGGNPNITELLYVDPSDHILISPLVLTPLISPITFNLSINLAFKPSIKVEGSTK